jgi:hypothetical protein
MHVPNMMDRRNKHLDSISRVCNAGGSDLEGGLCLRLCGRVNDLADPLVATALLELEAGGRCMRQHVSTNWLLGVLDEAHTTIRVTTLNDNIKK